VVRNRLSATASLIGASGKLQNSGKIAFTKSIVHRERHLLELPEDEESSRSIASPPDIS